MSLWWKKSFGYQIYIRSFYDSNGDGIGDIRGIIEKLDYLNYLGVNLLWFSPFFASPNDDNGYDVSDFYMVQTEYGSLNDLKELIDKAHKLGIKIIIDLILNHTSDEHEWFCEAKKSKSNEYHDYYIWANGKEGNPPTNWLSFFGGSVWEYNKQTDEYYMHIFSKKMPDLNWENPSLQKELIEVSRRWLDLGVDGFRLDAIAHLSKNKFVNVEDQSKSFLEYSNNPKIHKYLEILNREVFSKYDCVTIGEVGGNASVQDALLYTEENRNELNMVFNFDHNWSNHAFEANNRNELKIDLINLKKIFNKWQNGLYGKSWNAIYWLNHDQPRLMSHYGNIDSYYNESAKMLAVALYFMWGTPFIYNGEEIGIKNPDYKSIKDFKDISTINSYNEEKKKDHFDEQKFIDKIQLTCRDSARSIMQWDDGENGGFSTSKPWNIISDNYKSINVKKEINDKDSILNFYKKIINVRLRSIYCDVIVFGSYKLLLENDPNIYCYVREYKDQKLLVICNFTEKTLTFPTIPFTIGKEVLNNYDNKDKKGFLLPYEAIVYEIKGRTQ